MDSEQGTCEPRAKRYKEITLVEAEVLFYTGCEFECAIEAKDRCIEAPTQWDKWVWTNTPPSMYPGDMFRVEVE